MQQHVSPPREASSEPPGRGADAASSPPEPDSPGRIEPADTATNPEPALADGPRVSLSKAVGTNQGVAADTGGRAGLRPAPEPAAGAAPTEPSPAMRQETGSRDAPPPPDSGVTAAPAADAAPPAGGSATAPARPAAPDASSAAAIPAARAETPGTPDGDGSRGAALREEAGSRTAPPPAASARLRAVPRRVRAASDRVRPLAWLPLLAAAVLWGYALPRIGFREMGDYGLLNRFPVAFHASLVVLTLGFLGSLRRAGTAPWWPGAYAVAMLFALKAAPAVLYDSVRYAWASKHDAVIDKILSDGTVHPHVELGGGMAAYDQWPGFFALNAALVRTFGVEGAASFMNWAPVAFGLLMLPVLVLLFRTFTDDWRLVWTAVWIFQLANWVGQDYLAPQGLAFLLYLTVLTVVVRHFVRPGSVGRLRDAAHRDPAAAAPPPPTSRRQRAFGIAVLVPLIAATNFSHQLTPVMLCATLFVLCLTRRYRNPVLLAVAALIMLVWDLTMGRPLFLGTLETLRNSVGDVLNNSRAGYAGEPTGPGPELVGTANILMVAVLACLAGTAVLLRRRLVHSALPLLLAAAAPVPMFAVNDYGGEMLFRVYLFGLPGTAFFAAAALVPAARAARTERARTVVRRTALVAAPLALTVLLAGFLPSYYGKDGMHYTPPAEVAFVEQAYEQAPEGSLFLATTGSFPGAYHRYDRYDRWFFAEQEVPENLRMLKDPVEYLTEGLPTDRSVFVLLTPTQERASIGEGLLPPGTYRELEAELVDSPRFVVVEQGRYGVLLRYNPKYVPEAVPDGAGADTDAGAGAGAAEGER
ncbi:hypothetical protein [Streptomyces sp. NPDC060194]|uniref:hypothetical protein n=1 Tax=Streptomyces sp. NPDC060194 TaxID=3347069 RepID=UPI0036497CB7